MKVLATQGHNLESVTAGIANGYLEVYRAWCSYYRTSPSEEFIHHVSNLVAKGSVDLTLDDCPGIEAKSKTTLNLLPVFAGECSCQQ